MLRLVIYVSERGRTAELSLLLSARTHVHQRPFVLSFILVYNAYWAPRPGALEAVWPQALGPFDTDY